MNKLRDFLGLPKEIYHWDTQDIKISFFSIPLFLAMASAPFISNSEVISSNNIQGYKVAAVVLVLLAFSSFISFIVLTIKNNRNSS